MRSRASYQGHPLHPALIPFPFAFLTGAFVFDVAALLLGHVSLAVTARHLAMAGIACGVLAAVPGIIDYLNTVPPRSSAKRRARQHGLLNTAALVLFALALALRDTPVSLMIVTIEGLGTLALARAGWLGGVLVSRNLISVDHRYAEAGKWKEAALDVSDGTVVAAREDELKPGQMKLLHVDGRRIALGRTSRGYVAFDDRCTHRGGSLAGGVLIDNTVQCLWHGSQFDVETGAVRCGPAKAGIATHAVDVRDGRVRIRVNANVDGKS